MTSPAILARLNPANVRFDVGRGGIPELDQCDIASALAGLPRLPELAVKLALVKYAGRQDEVGKLFYWVRDAAVDMAVRHRWPKPRKGQLGGISVYAIWENVDPHHCPQCDGSCKRADNRGRLWNCPTCNGNGRIAIGDDYRAEVAGLSASEWANGWGSRAMMLSDYVAMMDRRAVSRVKSRLSTTD